jgi:hypothetical protein
MIVIDNLVQEIRQLNNQINDSIPHFKKTDHRTKLLTVYNKAGRLLGSKVSPKDCKNYSLIEVSNFESIGSESLLKKYRKIEHLKAEIAVLLNLKVFRTGKMPKETKLKIENLITQE